MLDSSGYPLNRILMFMFQGLARGFLLPSHFLNAARSSNACPFFHEIPIASMLGYLDYGELF